MYHFIVQVRISIVHCSQTYIPMELLQEKVQLFQLYVTPLTVAFCICFAHVNVLYPEMSFITCKREERMKEMWRKVPDHEPSSLASLLIADIFDSMILSFALTYLMLLLRLPFVRDSEF